MHTEFGTMALTRPRIRQEHDIEAELKTELTENDISGDELSGSVSR
jgi:hypothetical protein